jgi:hypothetical protein
MRSKQFRRGVREVREGKAPRFDQEDNWSYEHGRQWAVFAPRDMPVMVGRQVNFKALMLFLDNNLP